MAQSPEDQFQSRQPATARGLPPVSAERPGLPADWLLLRRPHLQLRGDTLLSNGLPDRRRQLSSAEIELWNLLQRSVSVQEALQSCGVGGDLLIRRFLDDGLCELA